MKDRMGCWREWGWLSLLAVAITASFIAAYHFLSQVAIPYTVSSPKKTIAELQQTLDGNNAADQAVAIAQGLKSKPLETFDILSERIDRGFRLALPLPSLDFLIAAKQRELAGPGEIQREGAELYLRGCAVRLKLHALDNATATAAALACISVLQRFSNIPPRAFADVIAQIPTNEEAPWLALIQALQERVNRGESGVVWLLLEHIPPFLSSPAFQKRILQEVARSFSVKAEIPMISLLRGYIYSLMGDAQRALPFFQGIIEHVGDRDPEITMFSRLCLAFVLFQEGKNDNAQGLLEKILMVSPHSERKPLVGAAFARAIPQLLHVLSVEAKRDLVALIDKGGGGEATNGISGTFGFLKALLLSSLGDKVTARDAFFHACNNTPGDLSLAWLSHAASVRAAIVRKDFPLAWKLSLDLPKECFATLHRSELAVHLQNVRALAYFTYHGRQIRQYGRVLEASVLPSFRANVAQSLKGLRYPKHLGADIADAAALPEPLPALVVAHIARQALNEQQLPLFLQSLAFFAGRGGATSFFEDMLAFMLAMPLSPINRHELQSYADALLPYLNPQLRARLAHVSR